MLTNKEGHSMTITELEVWGVEFLDSENWEPDDL